jgi:hypothetical protein
VPGRRPDRGDHFGGEFVKEPFRRHGLSCEIAKQPKSDLYRDLLPLLNSGRIMLPKHDRLVSQIVGLGIEIVIKRNRSLRSITITRTDINTIFFWRTRGRAFSVNSVNTVTGQ